MNPEPSRADSSILHGTIATMNADGTVLPEGGPSIADGTIAAVGPATEMAAYIIAPEALDASRQVALPSLINAHTYGAMTL